MWFDYNSCCLIQYHRQYVEIETVEQRQLYKNDFNADYDEYRELYAEMAQRVQIFQQLHERMTNAGSNMREVCNCFHKEGNIDNEECTNVSSFESEKSCIESENSSFESKNSSIESENSSNESKKSSFEFRVWKSSIESENF